MLDARWNCAGVLSNLEDSIHDLMRFSASINM